MATFAYRAINDAGRSLKGTITAKTSRHARDQLRERGLMVESVREKRAAVGSTGKVSSRPRHAAQLTTAIRELATLLQAGVPLLESLDSIVDQAKSGFRTAMLAVRDQVEQGSSLANAMAENPSVFDQMIIGMVRVGEHAGNLDEVCAQVADYRERASELKDRVLSAMLYPCIVLGMSVGVTIFLMTVVVPMLLQNLIELDRPLPWPTRLLKVASDAILAHGFWLVLLSAFGVLLAGWYFRTFEGRKRWDAITLKIPLFGKLIQKQALSRMSLVISSLLRSGVELVDALEIAEKSATNRTLQLALTELQQDLKSGNDLKASTAKHLIFTHAVAQVFYLGQQSGQLDEMLERVGKDYDRQSAILANRLTTILEPILILVLSVIVGFILFATVLPILEAGNVLAE